MVKVTSQQYLNVTSFRMYMQHLDAFALKFKPRDQANQHLFFEVLKQCIS